MAEAGSSDAAWMPPRKSFGSSRTSFTGRSRFWSDGSSRRPLISAPSDFRHVQTGSFHFPPEVYLSNRRPTSRRQYHHRNASMRHGSYFRPLELSIYMPDRRMSPMLPHFEFPRTVTPPPPPAYCAERSDEDHQLARQHSYSSMSFHVPRRLPADVSPSAGRRTPPQIPPKSKNRARAYTAPDVDFRKERIASGLIEMEKLQKRIDQIDDYIERQSQCASSRPSSSHSMAQPIPNLEPMPSIPALPPAAPSFAERLNADVGRPRTAPVEKSGTPTLTPRKTSEEGTKVAVAQVQDVREHQILSPPLPLVIRPPLRKKKSFSRVSRLFSGQEQIKNGSFHSVTNKPKPIKRSEGFYQVVSINGTGENQSCKSIDSLSTWGTEDEECTAPTTWSPDSTPASRQEEQPAMERIATFGKNDARLGQPPVGVAV